MNGPRWRLTIPEVLGAAGVEPGQRDPPENTFVNKLAQGWGDPGSAEHHDDGLSLVVMGDKTVAVGLGYLIKAASFPLHVRAADERRTAEYIFSHDMASLDKS